jgi:hypothetical protein
MERQLRCSTCGHRACRRRRGDSPETDVIQATYTCIVDASKNPNEDERGVDIGQIRGQLKLTVAERVRDMVNAANVMMTMQENARRFREAQSR